MTYSPLSSGSEPAGSPSSEQRRPSPSRAKPGRAASLLPELRPADLPRAAPCRAATSARQRRGWSRLARLRARDFHIPTDFKRQGYNAPDQGAAAQDQQPGCKVAGDVF